MRKTIIVLLILPLLIPASAFSESIYFEGSSAIEYQINNGLLDLFNIGCTNGDCDLEFGINPKGNGKLIVSLPRELIDSKLSGVDIEFEVTGNPKNGVNRISLEYDEISSTETHRMLSIDFTDNITIIWVSGTYMKKDVMIIQKSNQIQNTTNDFSKTIDELGLDVKITNGKIKDVNKDIDSVIFLINSYDYGTLTITFPDQYQLSTFKEKNNIEIIIDGGVGDYSITASPPNTVIIPFEIGNEEIEIYYDLEGKTIPDWIRNNAKWWADGMISDNDFTKGLEYLIKQDILKIPKMQISEMGQDHSIPSWLKKNSDWWSQGLLSDNEFLKSIQYLIDNNIIKV